MKSWFYLNVFVCFAISLLSEIFRDLTGRSERNSACSDARVTVIAAGAQEIPDEMNQGRRLDIGSSQ